MPINNSNNGLAAPDKTEETEMKKDERNIPNPKCSELTEEELKAISSGAISLKDNGGLLPCNLKLTTPGSPACPFSQITKEKRDCYGCTRAD